MPEEGIRTRRKRLNCDTEVHRGTGGHRGNDSEGRHRGNDSEGRNDTEGRKNTEGGTTPREGRARTLSYEPKEETETQNTQRFYPGSGPSREVKPVRPACLIIYMSAEPKDGELQRCSSSCMSNLL